MSVPISYLLRQGIIFAAEYVKLAGLQAFGDPPVSTFQLPTGLLKLQMHALPHLSFCGFWGFKLLLAWQALFLGSHHPSPSEAISKDGFYVKSWLLPCMSPPVCSSVNSLFLSSSCVDKLSLRVECSVWTTKKK